MQPAAHERAAQFAATARRRARRARAAASRRHYDPDLAAFYESAADLHLRAAEREEQAAACMANRTQFANRARAAN